MLIAFVVQIPSSDSLGHEEAIFELFLQGWNVNVVLLADVYVQGQRRYNTVRQRVSDVLGEENAPNKIPTNIESTIPTIARGFGIEKFRFMQFVKERASAARESCNQLRATILRNQ